MRISSVPRNAAVCPVFPLLWMTNASPRCQAVKVIFEGLASGALAHAMDIVLAPLQLPPGFVNGLER